MEIKGKLRTACATIIVVLITGFINISAQTIDKIAAVVQGTIILQSDIDKQYADYLAQGNPPNPEIQCVILQRLLTQKVLSQQAVIDSVEITEDQVDSEVDRRMRAMISRAGTQERLEEFLKQSVLQYKDQIRPEIRELLVAQKMQAKITENVSVTPLEVKKFFESIPADSLPNINTEVEVGELVVYPKLLEEEKETFRKKIEEYRSRIEKGEDFATLAKLYSQDPGSAILGGDLDFQDRTQLVKEFSAMAFKLKPGELSPVFETEFGFHILQVIERRGEQVHTRHILVKIEPTPASMERAKAHIDSIYKNVQDKKISFSGAASLYSDNKETKFNGGMLLNAEEVENRTTYIPTDKLDPDILFTVDTMKVGTYSRPEPFKSKDGKEGYRFLYLKSKTEPHRANLEQDFPKIKIAALSDKTDRVIGEWFEKKRSSTYVRVDDDYKDCANLKLWLTGNQITNK
jgi:peptidyl-prolyl cis-trans isomerase SurA